VSDVALSPASFAVPSGVVFPPGAETDLAVTDVELFGGGSTANAFSYSTPGQYYDLIVTVGATLSTSASVVNRVADLVLFDQSGGRLWSSPAATAIPASSVGTYTWSSSATTAFSVMDGVADYLSFSPIPSTVLLPGYNLVLANRGMATGDTWDNVALVIIHVPTGPIGNQGQPDLVATPLVI
jgi:hypothetical protein